MHTVSGFLLQKEKYPMRENPESSQPMLGNKLLENENLMHCLFNSQNNSNNLPFKHPCFLYKPPHLHVTISIAHLFHIAAT